MRRYTGALFASDSKTSVSIVALPQLLIEHSSRFTLQVMRFLPLGSTIYEYLHCTHTRLAVKIPSPLVVRHSFIQALQNMVDINVVCTPQGLWNRYIYVYKYFWKASKTSRSLWMRITFHSQQFVRGITRSLFHIVYLCILSRMKIYQANRLPTSIRAQTTQAVWLWRVFLFKQYACGNTPLVWHVAYLYMSTTMIRTSTSNLLSIWSLPPILYDLKSTTPWRCNHIQRNWSQFTQHCELT